MAEKNWTELDEIDYRKVYPYELAEIMMDKQFTFIENHLQYPEVVFSALYSEYSSYLDRKKSGVNSADSFTSRLEEILPKVPQELIERMNKHYAEWEALVKAYLQGHPSLMQKLTEESKLKEVAPSSAEVGCKYIDFQGLDLNGDTLRLSETISGKKLVLLDFWASWCAPCMKEMPVVDSLYRKYRSKGLEVIGISSDQDSAAWKKRFRNVIWIGGR